MDDVEALAGWLADAGLRNLPVEELVDGFGRRLNTAGVPVARLFIGMNTLHPMIHARSMIWDRPVGVATRFEFQHAEIDSLVVRQSPFVAMFRDGIPYQRRTSTRRRSRTRSRCSASCARPA
jgi:adenylate cyclase